MNSSNLRMGVIGYGYWGPNLVRNFAETPGTQVTCVADMDARRLEPLKLRYPAVRTTSDARELIQSRDVDAIAIATPVSTHFDLAVAALRAGKHVLVEKPLTESSEKCRRLIDEAAAAGRLLMVDHTFPYTAAVKKIRELIQSGELGEVYYYDSVRVNLGVFQRDVSVIWDLAVHDLSIIDNILPHKPVAVSATGMSHLKGQAEDIAYLTLYYAGSTIAHIHVNWLAPVKVRQTLIGGSKKMVVYDDVEPTEKIKVYDKGVAMEASPAAIYQMMVSYRTGDMWAPKLDGSEALRVLAGHFLDCVTNGKEPMTSAESGLRVVRIMEAATQSMASHGQPIELG
ncbi:MAG TPA: Gfo/Idh/MocA family oxidoreductase [Candidatus Saccharimonadales bacterium]|nr:Gfo/Idh/MocA family oxidoreductase [Candidatus Saccharimonadales bacterium]